MNKRDRRGVRAAAWPRTLPHGQFHLETLVIYNKNIMEIYYTERYGLYDFGDRRFDLLRKSLHD